MRNIVPTAVLMIGLAGAGMAEDLSGFTDAPLITDHEKEQANNRGQDHKKVQGKKEQETNCGTAKQSDADQRNDRNKNEVPESAGPQNVIEYGG
jgi:hypothetical protein